MTEKRKTEIIEMIKSDFIRGVTKAEVEYFEAETGLSCESYNCGSCVYNFLKKVLKYYEEK